MASSSKSLLILSLLALSLLLLLAHPARSETLIGRQIKCALGDPGCKPGDPQAPENQEEEAAAVNIPSLLPKLGDLPDVDELPDFGQDLVVLGH